MKYFWSLSFFLLGCSFMTSAAFADKVNVQPKIAKLNTSVIFDGKRASDDQELIVKFTSNTTQIERNTILRQVNAVEESHLADSGFSFVTIAKKADQKTAAENLLKNKQVVFVEPNQQMKSTYIPEDPSYIKQWYLNKIDMPKAWDQTKGSSKITVAVIDDGVQQDHPELKGKIISPYNAVTGGTYYVPQEHATHVAGIIAASHNQSGIAGIAPNVKIMPINVFDGDEASDYDVAKGIKYAADHHADIINMSLGSTGYSYLLDYYAAYAKSKGVFIVAAAGNDGSFEKMYPAALDSVVGVSATDNADKVTFFSNHGSDIDFAAPGLNIYSTVNDSKYNSLSGTSMAAPIVTGVAALVRSKNPFLTPDQVMSVLKKSTVDLGAKGRDDYYGYGRIDAYKAVENTPSPMSKISGPNTYTMTGKNKAALSFVVSGKSNVSLTIKDASGKVIRQVIANKSFTQTKVSSLWDGKSDGGKFVSSGTYNVLAKISNSKNTLYKSAVIKVVNHTYPDIIVSGSYAFSPALKKQITIPFELTQKSKVIAVITDKSGRTVKTIIANKILTAGKKSLVWDGENSSGHRIKDSDYYLTLSLLDQHNKKTKTKKVLVKVDATKPSAKLTLSTTLFKMNNSIQHTANLDLKETSTIVVDVLDEKGTVIKRLMNHQAKPGITNISWNGENTQNQHVAEGNYRYQVQLKDLVGNTSIINSSLFTLQDWRVPIIQSDKDLDFNTSGPLGINYSLIKEGKVTIQLNQGESLIKSLPTNTDEQPGIHSTQWDGTDDNNAPVPDGDYQFIITVVDKYGQSQTFTGNIHVQINHLN